MEPAYQIPLEPEDLQLLGELTAIIGQVDEEMVRTVSGLISADRPTTNAVMGSSKVADNATIWSSLIRLRTKDEDILWLVEHALQEIVVVSKNRNDFVHAFFQKGSALGYGRGPYGMGAYGGKAQTTARRVKNASQRPISDLKGVRDQAARLSCLIAHIGWCMAPHGRDHPDKSPWLERLSPSLPPRLDTAEARREKARPVQRTPSEKSLRQKRRERQKPKA